MQHTALTRASRSRQHHFSVRRSRFDVHQSGRMLLYAYIRLFADYADGDLAYRWARDIRGWRRWANLGQKNGRIPKMGNATQPDEMNLGRHCPSAAASSIVALLMAVLALTRALMPSGYMLDNAGDDGRLIVHMCGGASARSIVVDLRTGATLENAKQSGTGVPANKTTDVSGGLSCPFAMAAVANLPTVSVPEGPAGQANLSAAQHFSLAHPVSWLSRPPLPGRGPPNVA